MVYLVFGVLWWPLWSILDLLGWYSSGKWSNYTEQEPRGEWVNDFPAARTKSTVNLLQGLQAFFGAICQHSVRQVKTYSFWVSSDRLKIWKRLPLLSPHLRKFQCCWWFFTCFGGWNCSLVQPCTCYLHEKSLTHYLWYPRPRHFFTAILHL